jgi:hypothetical protein
MSINMQSTAANEAVTADRAQALLSPEKRELERKWRSWTRSAISSAKKRQAERGVAVTMTSDGLMSKLHAANYRCALSGVEFRQDPFGRFGPTLPSVDRIDPNGPYSDDNTRVVCLRCRGSLANHIADRQRVA